MLILIIVLSLHPVHLIKDSQQRALRYRVVDTFSMDFRFLNHVAPSLGNLRCGVTCQGAGQMRLSVPSSYSGPRRKKN